MRGAAVATTVLCTLLAGCDAPLRPPTPASPSPVDAEAALAAKPDQSAADAISANIQSLHLVAEFPAPTIIDPRFGSGQPSSPDYNTVVGYARAGDAAIWTGHYLAAEALRFAFDGSPQALANAQRALDGIEGLVDVTAAAMRRNPGLLARFLWPDTWWYGDQMAADEGSHGVYRGRAGRAGHRWLGNTTRDQYSGVFFGLAIAYDAFDQIGDQQLRRRSQRRIRELVTRMLFFLLRNGWNVRMPDGSVSTTFLQRPDQQLTLLQVGRHVNPRLFGLIYRAHRAVLAANVATPIAAECQDPHGSYFKFNLNYINLYNLIRLEELSSPFRALYLNAYNVLRGCTASHQNAHFNMIDRELAGPHPTRDPDTREYLGLWLERPRRDYWVDHRDNPKYCPSPCVGDRAPTVIAVNDRVNTDFLWQRSPFLLYGGGNGTIETPAIDYLLPYWMARNHGVITQ